MRYATLNLFNIQSRNARSSNLMSRFSKWQLNQKSLVVIFDIVLVVASFLLALPRFLHPSLHMDESYYINASLRILSGEIFLQNTAFDKPFLTAWLPIPGILLFGENAIGFHFIHFLFYLCLGPLIHRLVFSMFSNESLQPIFQPNRLTHFLCFFFAACFVLHPWTILFCAGAFSEGAFLFGVAIYLWFISTGRITSQISHLVGHAGFLALLFCIKQTAFLLFPIPLVILGLNIFAEKPGKLIAFLPILLRELKLLAGKFLSSKWHSFLLCTFVAYCIVGPKKFFPVLRIFQQGAGTDSKGFFGEALWKQWSIGPLGTLGCAGTAVSLFFCIFLSHKRADRSQSTLTIALILSVALHICALALSDNVSSRYVLFFWIHALTLFLVFEGTSASRFALKHAALFFFGLSILGFPNQWKGNPSEPTREGIPNAEWDRIFSEVRDLLPKNSVVHNKDLSWYLAPYNVTNWVRFASADQEYIKEEQVGRKLPFFQYLIKGSPANELPSELIAIPKAESHSPTAATLVTRISGRQLRLTEKEFKSSLRLRSWQTIEYSVDTEPTTALETNGEPAIQLQVRKKVSCFLPLATRELNKEACYVNLHIQGVVLVSQGRLAEMELGTGRSMLTLSLQQLRIVENFSNSRLPEDQVASNQELFNLDFLIPVLYKSYFISLGPLPVELRQPTTTKIESIDLQTGEYALILTEQP